MGKTKKETIMKSKYALYFFVLLNILNINYSKAEDQKAKGIMCQRPDYPYSSLSKREEGNVRVLVTVNSKGKVTASEIVESSGFPKLDSAARKSFFTCKFKPATKDGESVESTTILTFNWKLPS